MICKLCSSIVVICLFACPAIATRAPDITLATARQQAQADVAHIQKVTGIDVLKAITFRGGGTFSISYLGKLVRKNLHKPSAKETVDLSVGSFFKEYPDVEKNLEPFLKNLRTFDEVEYQQWLYELERAPWVKNFSSKEEFEQFVHLLESTQERFLTTDLEINYVSN